MKLQGEVEASCEQGRAEVTGRPGHAAGEKDAVLKAWTRNPWGRLGGKVTMMALPVPSQVVTVWDSPGIPCRAIAGRPDLAETRTRPFPLMCHGVFNHF